MIEIKNINKQYNHTKVLIDVNLNISSGEICVILGPSGSGKSTLLNVIGGLENIDSGTMIVNNKQISGTTNKELNIYRRDMLGYIFQFYNLIPNLTVLENIEVCSYLAKSPIDMDKIIPLLQLDEHKFKYPNQLSGGQQQRVAIARAIVKNPRILLCDEPTGALDSVSSKETLILLEKVNKEYGTTILLVTHNQDIKEMADRILYIKDGRVIKNEMNLEKKLASNIIL